MAGLGPSGPLPSFAPRQTGEVGEGIRKEVEKPALSRNGGYVVLAAAGVPDSLAFQLRAGGFTNSPMRMALADTLMR